jgi:hypothetical protein
MPTMSSPDSVCFPSICRKSASAGGQSAHRSDVNSSTRTAPGTASATGALLIPVALYSQCAQSGCNEYRSACSGLIQPLTHEHSFAIDCARDSKAVGLDTDFFLSAENLCAQERSRERLVEQMLPTRAKRMTRVGWQRA